MNPLIKNSIIAVSVLAVLFVLYRVFFASAPEAPLTAESRADVPQESGDLVSLLLQVRSLKLSDDVLTDPAFTSLQDFTVTLSPKPVGRRNPFAEIGVGAGAFNATSSVATSSAQ